MNKTLSGKPGAVQYGSALNVFSPQEHLGQWAIAKRGIAQAKITESEYSGEKRHIVLLKEAIETLEEVISMLPEDQADEYSRLASFTRLRVRFAEWL